MKIDIREGADEITHIIFGEDGDLICYEPELGLMLERTGLTIQESDGNEVTIFMKDLDNLINALRKAKALWE